MARRIRFVEALREGMRQEMERDPSVFVMGEGVGPHGSCFKQTEGFTAQFGEDRSRDTPISELAIAGTAAGAALLGMRPIADLMWIDFSMLAMDQICNQAAKLRYISNGQVNVPVVYRMTTGKSKSNAAHHSGSFYSWYINTPGLTVVVPSTPYDAKGLVISAIRDDGPVIYLEHKLLLNVRGEVPEEPYEVPLGVADVKREGADLTVVATGLMVGYSLAAAETLAKDGASVEVIDPRTLMPYDGKAILASVRKTGRLLVVDEGYRFCGFASEIIAFAVENAMDALRQPPRQLTTMHTTIPFSPPMEDFVFPNPERIANEIRAMLNMPV
ncbi:MAG TPA: alpha-ketoacid dehydrogenase subunit beta [Candidatus Hydrogenedentes bacterium]|nr:alpha-ketoacid dehydrogenase subunit beta [Candidatus Hydrogenedentota bacterium]HQE84578.1 alpha-ketoacid dehydrogenase subunit beta [Candidatus Hydrogenedentota bacterium]HQH54753.1 alpha-ketoacid dehydrogenase subunit beta [Candidatus Hydrogenedentota bacterium]HQM48184.1 alpha-ketoacid dehydrogenase subunit beta [Candidatus Hydrogenedentota bacterium]